MVLKICSPLNAQQNLNRAGLKHFTIRPDILKTARSPCAGQSEVNLTQASII